MTHHARAAPALSCVHHGNLAVPLRPYNSVDEPQDQHGCACSANLSKPHFLLYVRLQVFKSFGSTPIQDRSTFLFFVVLGSSHVCTTKKLSRRGPCCPSHGSKQRFLRVKRKKKRLGRVIAKSVQRCWRRSKMHLHPPTTHNPSPNAGRVCGLTAFNGFTGPVVLQPTRESWCSQSVFAAAKQYSQREQNFERGCAAPPLRFSSSNWTVLKETHLCMSKMQQRLFFW